MMFLIESVLTARVGKKTRVIIKENQPSGFIGFFGGFWGFSI